MNQYVRTADRIIYVGDLIKDDNGDYCDANNNIQIEDKYIIQEAEFIEPLIDNWISVFKEKTEDGKVKWFQSFGGLAYYPKLDTFGCILTDKGLIYVAKVNENNKVELL